MRGNRSGRRSSPWSPRSARGPGRPAFTLVELLVVMGIILALAALGYILLPGLFNNYGRVRAVDNVTQYLLIAKQRAKRDGLPTGVRLLLIDENGNPIAPNDDGTLSVRRLQYVQQPEPLVGGSLTQTGWTGGVCVSAAGGTVTFNNVDFRGGSGPASEWVVQPGDVLELFGGGGVYAIADVPSATTLRLNDPSVTLTNATANYRILRQPRPLQGEPIFTIPSDVVIDLGKPTSTGARGEPTSFKNLPAGWWSQNVPERLVANAPPLYLEILFSPNAGVVGTGGGAGKVLLWMRDTRVSPPRLDTQTILSINVRTGYIAAHEPSPLATNPYANTEDGRSSGL